MTASRRLLDQVFSFHIDAGSRVIENEDSGIEQQRARDGDTLLLPAGERDAALADPGIVAIRQRHDKIMDASDFGGGDDLLLAWHE